MNQPSSPISNEQRIERNARRRWIGVVIALLGSQVIIGVVAVILAVSSSSTVVMPNYHQAALDWDQTHRERTAAQRLAWQVEWQTHDVVDDLGRRLLQLQLKDRDGKPLDQLNVQAQIYHHASASQVRQLRLDGVGEGKYQALAPMAQPGLWQVDIDIKLPDQRVTLQKTFDLQAP